MGGRTGPADQAAAGSIIISNNKIKD